MPTKMMKKYDTNDDKFVNGLIRDIKKNKIGYVRRPSLVATIKEMEPDIEFKYDKEEDIWIASYHKEK